MILKNSMLIQFRSLGFSSINAKLFGYLNEVWSNLLFIGLLNFWFIIYETYWVQILSLIKPPNILKSDFISLTNVLILQKSYKLLSLIIINNLHFLILIKILLLIWINSVQKMVCLWNKIILTAQSLIFIWIKRHFLPFDVKN